MGIVMMEREKEGWNENRIDDLNRKVDEGFKDMREEFRVVRGEMAADRRALFKVGAAMWVTSVVGFLGVLIKL